MKKNYLIRQHRAIVSLIVPFSFLISSVCAQTKTTVIDFSTFSGVGLSENVCNVFAPSTNVNVQINGVGGYTLPHYSTLGTQRYFQSKGTVDLPCADLGGNSVASAIAIQYPFKSGYTYTLTITASNGGVKVPNLGLWANISLTLPDQQQQQGASCFSGFPTPGFADVLQNAQEISYGQDFSTVTLPAVTIPGGLNYNYINLISAMLTTAADVFSVNLRSIQIVETAPSNITCALPAPASASYSINPDYTTTFSWSPVSNAFQYRISVTDIHNGVPNQQTYYANTTTLSYCALGSGDNVSFTVQAICDNNMPGQASSPVSFTVPFPPSPTPSYDFSNCNKVEWQPISGAGSYTLEVQDVTTGAPSFTFNTANFFASIESDLHLTSGHNYQATVRAFGGNGCAYETSVSSPVTFTAITPYLSAPTGLAYDGTANTLSWTSVPNATNYSVQYADLTANTGTFFANVNFTNSVSGTTLSFVPGDSYQVSVSAINTACNNYQSAYSSPITFTAGPPPGGGGGTPPPTCQPPTIVHIQALGNRNVQISFLAPTGGQTPSSYNVKLDNFAGSTVSNIGTTSPAVVRPNSTGTYTISMQSVCSTAGTSSYVTYFNPVNVTSTVSSSTAVANVLADADKDGDVFRVYPTPASGEVRLSFQGIGKQKAEIVVTGAGGNIVLKKEVGEISSGQNTYTLDVSKLVSGFYMIRLVTGQSSQTRKLVIQK